MLIALDMDGTVMRNDKSVSDRTLRVLQECRRQGHRVTVATGRPPVLQGLHYTGYPEPFWDAGVYGNGSQVFIGDAVLEEHLVEAAVWSGVYRAMMEDGHPVRFAANPADGSVVCNFSLHDFAPHYTVYRDIGEEDMRLPVSKVYIYTDAYWTVERIRAMVPAGCRSMVLDAGKQVNFFCDGCSKAQGVAAVAAHFGMTMADVIAFGDDQNDLEMLRAAGQGVAMGNAYPQVLREIPRHTLTNEEDGIAVYLEEHLPGGRR